MPENFSNMVQFIVYLRYKSQLKAYSKRKFDPFCRNDRISDWGPERNIVTTIGQLNFFRWAIDNKILEYIKQHLKEIEDDMNNNIRKNNEKKLKKSLKNKNDSNNTKSKRKRRELSSCATKTLTRHNLNVVIDFD